MRRVAPLVVCVALAWGARGSTRVITPTPGSGTIPTQGSGSLLERLLGGAASGGRSVGVSLMGYLGGRALDLVDIAELNIGVGPGLKGGIEYGLGRTTLGVTQSQRVGLDGRQIGTWYERNGAYGIFPVSLIFAPFELFKKQGEVCQALAEGGFELGTVGIELTSREGFATTTSLYKESRMAAFWHERPGDMCSVGAEAHLLLIGARARFKPVEFVDFLLGFVGVDLDPQLAHSEGRELGGSGIRMPVRDMPAIRTPDLSR